MLDRAHPSKAYKRSVREQTAHHAASKTFSGSLLEPHLAGLDRLIDVFDLKSALDYGCGKAVCWAPPADGSATLQKRLDLRGLTLYDPCVPEFADERGLGEDCCYDLVILSHVLFWIPLEDLKAWVLPEIDRLARKMIFVVETIGDEKKRILSDREAHPRGLHAIDWLELLLPLQRPDRHICLLTEYRASDGRIYAGGWQL